jgi:ankyrin repeat protein
MSHRFQWVFCQLETLRHAVQPDIREILKALPRTLDETYERMLKNINEKNRKHARRLLHCLAVSARPLRVEELAEILTFDFDGAQGSIPKFYSGRRPKDQEEAVLSICSSLISIVHDGDSRVVQFSHLSVKEFLTSSHLASSTWDLPLYHILPGPAHTILAQACLGLLLHLGGRNYYENITVSPLAAYAAQHWVAHAQFEDVASHVLDGMKTLFDPDKPHFSAWISLFDVDADPGWRLASETPSPLYYAAFYGFHDLVRHLASEHPQDINALGGSYEFPLFAALRRNHFRVAETLLEHGGNVDVREKTEQTALHKIIDWHDKARIDAVQFLLEHGADVNAQQDDLRTPLHLAVYDGNYAVARMLLGYQADVNLRNGDGHTPLHMLSKREASQVEEDDHELARLLLERGANMNEKDNNNATPLHLAAFYGKHNIVRVLLNHRPNANAETKSGETALHGVSCIKYDSQADGVRVAQLLLACGADVNAPREDHSTPLHVASSHGKFDIAQLLLDNGANPNGESDEGERPLHRVSCGEYESQDAGVRVAQLLLERGAHVNAQRNDSSTPLHLASYNGKPEIVHLLLDWGADANAESDIEETPLHSVSCGDYESQEAGLRVAELLLEHEADVSARRRDHSTPLHVASYYGNIEIVRLLLDNGANADAKSVIEESPLHKVSCGEYELQEAGARVAQLLLEHGADVNAKCHDRSTPLHLAALNGKLEIARSLLDWSADVNVESDDGETALHKVSCAEYEEAGVRVTGLLLERGADVNALCDDRSTPLHLASYNGKSEIARLLLDHDADANAESDNGETPLHRVSCGEYESQDAGVRVAELLLERGAEVNARRHDQWTPLHIASYLGKPDIARVLLTHGAKVDAVDSFGKTPLHDVSKGTYESEDAGLDVARLLLEHGADVDALTRSGETPLDAALDTPSHRERANLVQLLLDNAPNFYARISRAS